MIYLYNKNFDCMKKKEYIKPASSIYVLAVEADTAGFGQPTNPAKADLDPDYENSEEELHDASWWDDYWEKHPEERPK